MESAWLKGLSIYKTIFDQVTKACTISSEPTSATMCWGMMKATDLLDEFSKLKFVRHPEVTYAMSLSALQKDAKDGTTSLKAELADTTAIAKRVDVDLKALKRRNPNLNQ